MSAGRPGGLTALAVINFIFGGYGLIVSLSLGALVVIHYSASSPTGAESEQAEAMVGVMGVPTIIVALSLLCLASLLGVLAGFGHLRQKRILGRWFGNAFAFFSIAAYVTLAVASRGVPGMGFTPGTLFGVLYPLLTLFLINTTFREDLVN